MVIARKSFVNSSQEIFLKYYIPLDKEWKDVYHPSNQQTVGKQK
jgi:hypothetical protein